MADDIKTKKADPGWNDPPTLSYSLSNPPPKSRIGNKRIAFPLSTQTSSSQSLNSSNPKTFEVSNISQNFLVPSDCASKLEGIMKNVKTLLVNQDGQMHEKLEVMRVMWQDNKFNTKIQSNIASMVKEMVNGDPVRANEYYLQLMMENSTLCAPWIAIFGQLIRDMSKR